MFDLYENLLDYPIAQSRFMENGNEINDKK